MIRKLLIILCSSVLAHAGIIGSDFSPATSVSYTSFSSSPVFTKTIEQPFLEKTQEIVYERPELSPIYESVLNTQENKYETEDGSKHRTFSKSLDTGDSKIRKLEAYTTKDSASYSVPSFSVPAYTEAIYQSGSYSQESTSPLVYSSSPPVKSVTYSAQAKPVTYVSPLTKSVPTYSIGASPIVYNTKVYPGLSAYASPSVNYGPTAIESHSSDEKQLISVTYSDNPAVSHVTFSGAGVNYSW